MAKVKEVFWTAHPRVDVEYKKAPREYNTQTKHEFWDACTEEDRTFVRQLAETFDAVFEEPK